MTSEEIKNYCEEALTISKQQGTQGGLTIRSRVYSSKLVNDPGYLWSDFS